VTETDEEAREAVWQTRWQRRTADHLRRDDQRLRSGRNEAYPVPGEADDAEWWSRLVYGTPERCIERLRRDAELGISGFMGWFDVGGIPGDKVRKSMRLFAREVMPALAELSAAAAR
jgi:alkanesulfonate monooxygenase SsuD/methylene tetrahydromethanopterin reductase-like flavin-dependent oxidoreductase (luciferase family)